MGVGGQRHAPTALPPGMTRYPLYRRLGGPQGRSGRVRKISPFSGFDPRTVQPVVSRYTDCSIPDHSEGSCPMVNRLKRGLEHLLPPNSEICNELSVYPLRHRVSFTFLWRTGNSETLYRLLPRGSSHSGDFCVWFTSMLDEVLLRYHPWDMMSHFKDQQNCASLRQLLSHS